MDSDFEYASEEHGELIRACVPWLVWALANAHDNREAKQVARRLLAAETFSLNLKVDKAWDPLMKGVREHLQALGRPLQEHSARYAPRLHSGSLKIELLEVKAGDAEGRRRGITGQARLDCEGFLRLPPWDWDHPVAMREEVWIHVIRLIALAINQRCGEHITKELEGLAEVSVAGIKSFIRMRNKMLANEDHRYVRRPRPSRNIDINRCLAVVEDEDGMRKLCGHCAKRFGIVKVKNGFDLSPEDAAAIFELRVVMLTLRYKTGLTYGEIARDPEVESLWSGYVKDVEEGIPHTRWKAHVSDALAWLRSAEIAGEQVITMVEVQALLRPFYDVRQHMHELYKAYRAANGAQLHADFQRTLPKPPEEEEEEAETLLEAAEWNQAEVAKRLLEKDRSGLDARDSQGYTPLLVAACKGFADVGRVLVQAGTNSIDEPSGDGENTPLLWCAQKGYADVATVLVEAGAQSLDVDARGTTPLLWCAQEGFPDVAKVLVDGGAKSLDRKGEFGNTPLMWCAQEGFADVAQVLIDGGARSFDEPRADGITPLLLAARGGFQDVVAVLVRAGADVDASIRTTEAKKGHSAEAALLRTVKARLESSEPWLT